MSRPGTLDRFEIRIQPIPPERRWLGLAQPRRAHVFASVWINDAAATADCVAIHALLDAAQGGTIFPFTCSCGDAGCAGYVRGVHVLHDGGETLWADQDAGVERVFDTAAFLAEIGKLDRAVAEARARWPDVAIEPWE